jgi:tRNA (guanine-N7-)-methyltransferase
MHGNSPKVTTNQDGLHPHIDKALSRHNLDNYKKGISPGLTSLWPDVLGNIGDRPLVLDAGCGTGDSTARLAELFPEHFILGVDKSINRQERGENRGLSKVGDNWLRIRSDLVDVWRLLLVAKRKGNIRITHQFILYPNPWPLAEHFKRRWHGHPVFPFILALGGIIELRSNWKLYLEEWDYCCRAKGLAGQLRAYSTEDPWTPFEEKFLASGHELWQWLSPRG